MQIADLIFLCMHACVYVCVCTCTLAPQATLADAFLADFEEGDSEEEEDDDRGRGQGNSEGDLAARNGDNAPAEEPLLDVLDYKDIDALDDEDADAEQRRETSNTVGLVEKIATLLHADAARLSDHMALLERMKEHKDATKGEEHDVIVRSNDITAAIDGEILSIHKYVRDLYATKFPELADLVPHPYEYARVCKAIGNRKDVSGVALDGIVPQNVQLTITVTATTTVGKPLPPGVVTQVIEGCDAILKLIQAKKDVYTYIESRMNLIAPNLSAIVGPEVAARLMGIAGGLRELSEIPSCNIQVLGVKRGILAGFGSSAESMHQGVVAQCDLMLQTPPEWKSRAIRLVAAKCALAARIDAYMSRGEGSSAEGTRLREIIAKKIQKWQEPPPAKAKRALPVPKDAPKKKRGGKRYRKQRERTKVTELMKQKNRMLFGKAQLTDEYTGTDFGMIGMSGSGNLRAAAGESQQLKRRLARKTKAELRRVMPGTATARKAAGTASTFAMTPVQGMELVRTAQAERVRVANAKYFASNATFFRVGDGGQRDSNATARTKST